MTWPKGMIHIEIYDAPREGDWHQGKYLVGTTLEGSLWTDNIDDVIEYLKTEAIKLETKKD